jgi:hypothetical protein
MTAQGYFTKDGRQVENAELAAVDTDGRALPLVPSTLGVAQELVPAEAREVLDLGLTGVYRLTAESVAPDLAEALQAGDIFRVPFNYRPDYRSETAFIVGNDAGTFVVVGTPAAPAWLEPDAPPPVADEQDGDDDLDFEMF